MTDMAETLLIKSGRVIDPASKHDAVADVLLEHGKVMGIFKPGKAPLKPKVKVKTIDAKGCIVTPGLIDTHTHMREPGNEEKETILTGATAAVRGGYTSICCMPNTQPAIDDNGRIEFIYRQSLQADMANVFPLGTITKRREGKELAEIGLMAGAGAVGFSDDGFGVASASVMSKVLSYIAMTGKPLMQHCEDADLAGGAMNAGALASKLGIAGMPRVAEELMLQRDLLLNLGQNIGCKYHMLHVSTAGAVERLRQARATPEGARLITAEATPHHLLLTEEACSDYNSVFKVNPPLRTKKDNAALVEGVKDGTITILATDHAPHTREEKELEFAQAPYGMIGLECSLALFIKALVNSGAIDWAKLVELMTLNPAQLVGLSNKGRLAPGMDADVTVINPEHEWTIDSAQFASKSRNCPFDGWKVKGRAVVTVVGGSVKFALDDTRLG